MEKITQYEQDLRLLDELLAITDSTRRTLLALKRSKMECKPTLEQQEMMSLLGIKEAGATRQIAQQLIDQRAREIVASIAGVA